MNCITIKNKKESSTLTQYFRGKKFLEGPIPLIWVKKAARLPGKAFFLALILWYLTEVENSMEVHLSSKTANVFGIKRRTGYRALKALEDAGLISVQRCQGRCPKVTILEINE